MRTFHAAVAPAAATATVADAENGTVDNAGTAPTAAPAAAIPPATSSSSDPSKSVETRTRMIKQKLLDCKREKYPIEKNLKLITGKIENAKKYRTSLNDKIKEFKKIRKRRGDGIESEMFVTLKLFGIEVQAYHGGSLHGKDVQKLMSNASDIFKSFADTLKKCKKD